METIAFINGGTFVYWSSIILTIAVLAAIACFAGFYLWKSKNGMALSLTVPVAILLSVAIARWVHWYCLTDSYDSLHAAMTDYTWGGYALTGAFIGCLLTACIMRLLQITRGSHANCNTQLASCKYPRTASSQHLSRISKKRC